MAENTKENPQDIIAERPQDDVPDENLQNDETTEQKITEAIGILLQDVENKAEELEEDYEPQVSVLDVEDIISDHRLRIIEMLNEESAIFIKTDKQFLDFLTNFVITQDKKEVQKLDFKERFFSIVMIGFLILLVTPFALILSIKDMSQTTAVVSMIAVLIELVSAIIVLPQIIAEYLFNKKEDEKLMQIIETMQDYNQNRHAYISKFNDDN